MVGAIVVLALVPTIAANRECADVILVAGVVMFAVSIYSYRRGIQSLLSR